MLPALSAVHRILVPPASFFKKRVILYDLYTVTLPAHSKLRLGKKNQVQQIMANRYHLSGILIKGFIGKVYTVLGK